VTPRPVVMTLGEVAAAVGGRLAAGDPAASVGGFSIDSRTAQPGDLFVAIRGDRFDGHAFVGDVLRRGACGAVVSDPAAAPAGGAAVQVADTVLALQALARHIRRASGARVVAVTGSAGKTTTKDVTADLVGLHHRVYRNRGNFNNHIGLPLSLLDLRQGPEVAVVELGMNHAGEIRTLVGIAEPDVRVWTNVAEVHAEFFASLEAIADAKAEILEGATRATTVVANAGDPLVMARVRGGAARVVTFGLEVPADVEATGIRDLGLAGTEALVRTRRGEATFRVPLLGRASLANVLAATAVALEFDLPLDEAADRVRTLSPSARRGEVWRLRDGITVVDDSYNSNPRALMKALDVIAHEPARGRRLAVLGEMLELGGQSVALHRECGRAAAAAGLDRLIAVGGAPAGEMARAAQESGMPAGAAVHVAASAEAADLAVRVVAPGDLVLVKGSRGTRTDVVADRLKAEFA
jgi:UDP-N-acetylmuramoyl-tripeptide--D-alanyl-D-alanine ligase